MSLVESPSSIPQFKALLATYDCKPLTTREKIMGLAGQPYLIPREVAQAEES